MREGLFCQTFATFRNTLPQGLERTSRKSAMATLPFSLSSNEKKESGVACMPNKNTKA
jgi:hypothetical protein